MPFSIRQVIDYGKQIQALLAGAPPAAIWKYGFLEINPPIISRLWVAALLLAIIASAFAFNAPQRRGSRMPTARMLGLYGITATVFSVAGLMLITDEHIFTESPSAQDIGTRILFLSTFTGLGLFMGWQISAALRMLAQVGPDSD